MAGSTLASGHERKVTVLYCGFKITPNRTIEPDNYGDRGTRFLATRAGFEATWLPLIDQTDAQKTLDSIRDTRRLIITGSPLSPLLGTDELADRVRKVDMHMLVLEVIKFAAANGIPTLGICYGHQMIGVHAGAKLERLPRYHFGFQEVHTTSQGKISPLFAGLPRNFDVAKHHAFGITDAGSSLVVLANNQQYGFVEAVQIPRTNVYGVQFHPDYHSHDIEGLGRGDLTYYGQYSAEFLASVGYPDAAKPHSQDHYRNNCAVLDNFLKIQ